MSGAPPPAGAGSDLERRLGERARSLAPRMVEMRRDLHRHPEIAFEEVRTAGVIEDALRSLGLEPRTGVGRTGVVAVLEGGGPGPDVLLRADMDALPVREERESPYRSTIDGAMHACGHDGHVAALLGAAEALASVRSELPGRVVFAFQPAEEIVRGAAAMLEDGALDGLDPVAAYGVHLSSNHPTGTIAFLEGPAMAATDSFRLIVRGRGGHAALPHQAVDPVVAAAHVVTGLQALVARETDPVDRAVVSFTSVHGGSAFNVIPGEVELKGTLRTFLPETRERLSRRIVEAAAMIAGAFGAGLEPEWTEGSPAVVNDPERTAFLRGVARDAFGDACEARLEPMMGGDDMALWLQRAPGCYAFVGARDEAAGYDLPHHHPRFDLDERALPVAAELLARAAARTLREAGTRGGAG